MHSAMIKLYIHTTCEKKVLNSIGHQLRQYQQNKQSPIIKTQKYHDL